MQINGLPPKVSIIDYQRSEMKKNIYNDVIIKYGRFAAGKHIPGEVNMEAIDYLNQFRQRTKQNKIYYLKLDN